MDGVYFLKWLEAAIPPMAFLLILWAMRPSERSRRTALRAAGFLAAEAVVQALIFALGDSPELVFTLLPLTFYLPAIVLAHLLSKGRFLPTALAWLLAMLCACLLSALQKLLTSFFSGLSGPSWDWLSAGIQVLAAAALLLFLFRWVRTPFLASTRELEGHGPSLLLLPVMLLALYSYFLSDTTNATVLLLLFLTALAAFLALARLIASLAEERRSREARLQMNALRRDYEALQKKLELGRSYRHDLRHHMTVLSALLQEENNSEAKRYIADWQGQLSQIEEVALCRNAAVNGVLSAYQAQAREAGCTLKAAVSLPGEFPFEEIDLCVVLANALENALHACKELSDGTPRQIDLSLGLTDRRRLTLQVENPCLNPVVFDGDGFPQVPRREGHGQGLRSIAAVAEKYHGLFRCDCQNGTFTLQVVLLDTDPKLRRRRRAPTVCAGVFLCLFLLNCMPALAQALERVPVLGQIVRVADLRTYSLHWGASGITVQDPALEGNIGAVEAAEAQKEAFIRQMEERFLWYAARKYQGYAAEDIAYDVARDDEALFILRFTATLNAGGSVDYSRHIVLEQESGRVLALSDLFQPEANYIFPISREIQAQMAEQNNAGEANYFLPGGIWPDEECFRSIDPDQNFYIDENDRLVIVFEEYEVAPGSMGTPEFVIPTDVLDGLLAQPPLLR